MNILEFFPGRARFCHDLELAARAYLMRHFVTVATQSDEILGLPLKDLEAIVSDDELNVKNEEVVWECVLRLIFKKILNLY